MSRVALASALWCALCAAALLALALRRGRALRAWHRARVVDPPGLGDAAPDPRAVLRVRGVLEPEPGAKPVHAPFSERPALWVHAQLWGVGPGGGPPRVLWEKTLAAPARLAGPRGAVALPLASAAVRVLAPREYRQGVVRTLTRASRIVARALVRAGFDAPPPPGQLFVLEETALLPGDEVTARGRCVDGALAPPDDGALLCASLAPARVALRLGWGPALALALALCALALALTMLWAGAFVAAH